MIRQANEKDIDRIAEIYDAIHTAEAAGRVTTGWQRNIYPTRKTAEESIAKGDMFVEVDGNTIAAAGRINQEQLKEYAECSWLYQAPDQEIMVLHTLVVDPSIEGKGYGTEFVKYYEDYALSRSCHYLRMDTNERNVRARKFYEKLGFREAGIVLSYFNGIPDVRLVCLEKKI